MQRKNIFDLLALKEKVASNKFLHRMQPLKEEKIKVEKILVQLKALKNDGGFSLSQGVKDQPGQPLTIKSIELNVQADDSEFEFPKTETEVQEND